MCAISFVITIHEAMTMFTAMSTISQLTNAMPMPMPYALQ